MQIVGHILLDGAQESRKFEYGPAPDFQFFLDRTGGARHASPQSNDAARPHHFPRACKRFATSKFSLPSARLRVLAESGPLD